MKRLIYCLLAGAFVLASCGFVVAEKRPDIPKAAYGAKADVSDSKGTIKGIAPVKEAASIAEAVPEDPLDALRRDLDPNTYGDFYYTGDGAQLVISTVDRKAVEKALEKHGMAGQVKLVDAAYSNAQLTAANEAVGEADMDSLAIVGMGIDAQENGLIVWLRKDTPEIRARVMSLTAPVKTIQFVEVGDAPLPLNT